MNSSLIHGIKRILGKNLIAVFYRSLGFLSDKSYLRLIYRLRMGRKLDLDNPKTFTEKLQWLKLNDHNPVYTNMADKMAMRSYVEEKVGPGHTVPIIGVWERFSDIDFSSLPKQFVLKTTHDSGSYVICRDKEQFDIGKAKRILTRSLRRNYYRTTREWQYKNIIPRIICEQYLDDGKECLTDYKFFCFNGQPRFMYFEEEASKSPTQAIVDMDFHQMPFSMDDRKADTVPEKPAQFEQMESIAQKLSEGLPFLRVDMYCIESTIYVGEMTFYHYGGFIPFRPAEWDGRIGEMLDLSAVKREI
jgi:hypothetical protein